MKNIARLLGLSLISASILPGIAADTAAVKLAQANTAFALDLYRQERSQPGNLFFSPYSISTALAMTCAGASGQTAQEMARTLHFDMPAAQVHPAFAALLRRMDEIATSKQVSLSVANSLWCQQSYRFTANFLKLSRDDYGAVAKEVDFQQNSEAARLQINSWVADKTRNKIIDLLHPGDVSSETRLVLCDAIYFKGSWASRFREETTHDHPFFVTPTQTVPAPLMYQSLKLSSRQYDDLAVLSLPYAGDAVSMVILLPKALDGLPGLEQQLDAAHWRQWLSALDKAPKAKAEVFLPKFKLTRRLTLAHDLAALGMATAFGPAADFSGITGKNDLFLSQVVHQAFVDVNEEGTEAAAATGAVMTLAEVRRADMPVFRIDHPFLFAIRENQTGSILFLGRLVDPSDQGHPGIAPR